MSEEFFGERELGGEVEVGEEAGEGEGGFVWRGEVGGRSKEGVEEEFVGLGLDFACERREDGEEK